MKILVTGATGLLGSRYIDIFEKNHDVAGTFFSNEERDLHHLDIRHKKSVISIVGNINPDIIVHTAAISDPDICLENEKRAFKVNVDGTKHVAEAARRVGAKMVYISTTFVFSGEGIYAPGDERNPSTIYGQTKLKAEKAVSSIVSDSITIRCPKLFGSGRSSNSTDIVSKILRKLDKEGEVELDDEKIRYITFVDDIVNTTQKLIDIGVSGTFHVSTHEPITKYEFGNKVKNIFNVKGNIIPVSTNHLEERPSGVGLDTKKTEQLGIEISNVDKALKKLKCQRGCSFKSIYSFKPDELIDGRSASKVRIELGKSLAKDDALDADIVVPVPESGIYPAMGYADASNIPLYHGIIRDYETDRTLYESSIDQRNRKLRKKLIAVQDVMDGQEVILVDEAIISGLTMAAVIEKCRSVGAREIHIRIPSPPMRRQCPYGVLSGEADLLAGQSTNDRQKVQDKIQNKYDVDSVKFLSIGEFQRIIPEYRGNSCSYCFSE